MAQTISDLGKLVKGKYPGQYDDLSDADLGQKIKAKFPGAYDDFAELPPERTLGGFAGNVVTSAGRFGGDVLGAVTSPVQTVKALGALGAGLGEKLIPGEQGQEKNVDALVKMYVDRYGGLENLKKTAYEDPVGVLADFATLAGVVGLAAKGVGLASKAANLGRTAQIAGNVAKVAGTVGEATDPVRLATKGMSAAASPISGAIKTATTELLGKTTGVGSKAMARALEENSPELRSAMRGGLTETDLVNNFKGAMQNVKDARSDAYRQKLAQLPMTGPGTSLDISPIRNNLKFQLKKFNIVEMKNGDLDFSRSTIRDAAAQNEVRGIYKDITGWGKKAGDRTPAMVDVLKRRLDDVYSPSSTARSIVQSAKDSARNVLNKGVPGYQEMTAEYAKASQFLDSLSDLSLESKNPGTAVRKLTTLLNQNNGYRQMLAEKLSAYTPHDLEGQLAGLNLSKWGPRGIMGPASGVGLLYGVATHALNPVMAVGFAMTSPRLMGELLAVIAKTPSTGGIKTLATKYGRAATAVSRVPEYTGAQ